MIGFTGTTIALRFGHPGATQSALVTAGKAVLADAKYSDAICLRVQADTTDEGRPVTDIAKRVKLGGQAFCVFELCEPSRSVRRPFALPDHRLFEARASSRPQIQQTALEPLVKAVRHSRIKLAANRC